VIGSYSLIGHYSNLGTNCILRPGVMVNGKSTIGNNCVLNTRVTVTNKSKVSDNVELMAFSNVTKNITNPGKYIGSKVRKI
jgi:UDP-3-O-[3-hydroxymyristoyl] glucosamine N-acyltransferase